MKLGISIEGKSPLLQNRMTAEQLDGLRIKDRSTIKAGRPREPREEARPKVYSTEDGRPIVPVENLFACLIAAGVYIKLDGKRQLSTKTSSLIPGMLAIETPFLEIIDPLSKKTATWEVDIRQGRNPNGGEAVVIVRPRFDQWGFDLEVSYDRDQIDEPRVRTLFDLAGNRVGLGDFRPERRGIYGRFHVVRWQRIEE